MKKYLVSFLIFSLLLAACARGPKPGENPAEFASYRKAFHTAEAIYSLDALADLVEILKDGNVILIDPARGAVDYIDQIQFAVDEIAAGLETGFPKEKFEKAREIIKRMKLAVENGAIKFLQSSGKTYFYNIVGAVELSINLIEAFALNNKERVASLSDQRAMQIRALRSGAPRDLWWASALERATRLATEISGFSPLDAAKIWPLLRDRSQVAHDKNRVRIAAWRSVEPQ